MSKLDELQREYDEMVVIAMEALDNDLDLDPKFERELFALMKIVKSLGGKAQKWKTQKSKLLLATFAKVNFL